jgi:hypothetical protein
MLIKREALHETGAQSNHLRQAAIHYIATSDGPPVSKARDEGRKAGQTLRSNTTEVNNVSPWERRQRGGPYYTRSRKVAGRVVREYVGTGPLAELAAEIDAEGRLQRERQRQLWREERERIGTLENPVEDLCDASEILAQATLVAAGYRRHKRGEWRKRRERRAGTT